MRYNQAVRVISQKSGVPQKEVKKVIRSLVSVAVDEVARDSSLRIPGLGTLKVRHNTRTKFILKGVEHTVKKARTIAFSPAKTALETLNPAT